MTLARLYLGDCQTVMRALEAESVQTVVTSPPYWGLRDYGIPGQLGLEDSPEAWAARMVEVFRDVRRVLRKDGTLWVNLGDCYVDGGRGGDVGSTLEGSRRNQAESRLVQVRNASFRRDRRKREDDPHKQARGLKPKDLVGLPWLLATELRRDGWTLRDDIIWHKPNPMPESVTDRPTRAHEYIFLFSKSRRYYYDAAAIAEDLADASRVRIKQHTFDTQHGGEKDGENPNRSHRRALGNFALKHKQVSGWDTGPGDHTTIKHNKPRTSGQTARKFGDAADVVGEHRDHLGRSVPWTDMTGKRNSRSVWALPWSLEDAKELLVMLNSGVGEGDLWNIPIQPYTGAHFATFPTELAKRCILAGSRPGDIVLDPFGGRGTVSRVAVGYGRGSVYIDINPTYLELAREFIGPALCEGVA